ncbi:MAG: hypothetical protein ACTSW1_07315 [Candidatus Hodarchaeales archaeon]
MRRLEWLDQNVYHKYRNSVVEIKIKSYDKKIAFRGKFDELLNIIKYATSRCKNE